MQKLDTFLAAPALSFSLSLLAQFLSCGGLG